jgi:hypothetical protein
MVFLRFMGVVPDGPRSGSIRNLEVVERDSGFALARAPE